MCQAEYHPKQEYIKLSMGYLHHSTKVIYINYLTIPKLPEHFIWKIMSGAEY